MPALLAAKPYLNFGPVDLGPVYYLLIGIVGLAIFVAALWGLGRWRAHRRERKSAWRTFHKLARARGLEDAEVKILAMAVEKAKVKRPSQVLASIQLFDSVINDFLETTDVTSRQQAHLMGVRSRLVSSVEQWSKREEERRNLARAPSSLPVQFVIVSRDWMDEELKGGRGEEDPRFKEALEGLLEGLNPENARLQDISAGGMALLVHENIEAQEEDYVSLSGDADALPVDLNELVGKIVDIEKQEKQKRLVLHLRFLPYPQETRRQIIRLVYEHQEDAERPSSKKAKPKPVAGKKSAAGPQAESA